MTREVNEDVDATILQAEEIILRISEELGRMKTAAELLDDAGQRTQLLQDSVENLVNEIGSLVELSGRVIDVLNATEIRGLVTEMRTILARRIDGLRTEMLANTKSATERVEAILQTTLARRMDILGSGISTKTQTATEQIRADIETASELRSNENKRMLKRFDELETLVSEVVTEQISAEIVAEREQRMIENDEMFKRLDALGTQIVEARKLAQKASRRKGIFF